MQGQLTRRRLLQSAGMLVCSGGTTRLAGAVGRQAAAPVRAITRGPKFHWFGYYDKLQLDPSGRYALGMEVDFEHRSPTADDVIAVGMVDLHDRDRWIPLGKSRAWCWQQGCMLQWIPGSDHQIIWNDRRGGQFVSRVVDVRSRRQRTLDRAVYALSPDGRSAVAPDFARLQQMRPGYGYAGLIDPHAASLAPEESGVFKIDLASGRSQLVVSLARVASFAPPHPTMAGAKHYFNHLLFNPDGSRFIFLHRWRPDGGKGRFFTRMLTASADGRDLYVVDPSGNTSHFIWRDARHILAWSRPAGRPAGFYLFQDQSDKLEQVGAGVMTQNGHCSYLPGNEWILNDTYPERKTRLQHVYLYHVATGRQVTLGRLYSPPEYSGPWRCDTHPRFSPDGRSVVIDSPHGRNGRQMYLIDISGIVG